MQSYDIAPNPHGWALVLHGGAGGRVEELTLDVRGAYTEGLTRAYTAGADVLAAGGSALDAVCATVEQLEDDPLFNAGRGAALTAAGTAELDACVMTGDGRAGAITACRYARNPVLRRPQGHGGDPRRPARRPHARPGCSTGSSPPCRPEYFLTPARQQQLRNVQARTARGVPARHGGRGGARRAGPAGRGDVDRRDGEPERGPRGRHTHRRRGHLRPRRRRGDLLHRRGRGLHQGGRRPRRRRAHALPGRAPSRRGRGDGRGGADRGTARWAG